MTTSAVHYPPKPVRASKHFQPTRRTLATIVIVLLAFLPAIYIWSLVQRYGVDVPALDDWEMADVIAQARHGELTWRAFLKQEEEARMIVPKAITILSAAGGHWDVRRLMKLSVLVCIATAICIGWLLWRARLPPITFAISLLCITLLLFSPTQFELWFFASGLPSFLVPLFLVAALALYSMPLALRTQFIASALLATAASFTLAHGLLLWGLTFPVCLLITRPAYWKRWGAAWLVLATVCLVVYFYGYRRPLHLPEFAPEVSLRDYVIFFLAFLGNSFAYADLPRRVDLAMTAGTIVLLLGLAAALYTFRRRHDHEFVRLTLPWFALAAYAIGAAALATSGRVGMGVDWAVSSRYITFSLYLPVAVLALLAVISAEVRRTAASGWTRVAVTASCFILLGAGLGLFASCMPSSLHFAESGWARNRLAKANLVFSRVLDVSNTIGKLNYPHPPTALRRAEVLDELGLLRPRFVRTTQISQLRHGNAGGKSAAGFIDAVQPIDAETMRASGWAALPKARRPADCVALAYQTGEGDWNIFALSDAVVPRIEIVSHLGPREQLWSGWSATFPRAAVPPNARISAWGFDATIAKLYRLKQNTPELTL